MTQEWNAGSVPALTKEQLEQFEKEGYVLVKSLFSQEDVETLKALFEEIANTTVPGHFEPDFEAGSEDPLKRYPRVMHPHRFNETAKRYMLHPPVMAVLKELYGEEALAAQSMYYYKPPGSRGQALHQDNFYLKVEPGTCIAAWTAIDRVDPDNGGLLVVPKTQNHEIVCPDKADERESFTTHFVRPPEGMKPIPVVMEPGDTLFFNGNLIHGSYRNKTKDRFRRSFICHYANESASRISRFYHPVYRADGSIVDIQDNPDGGPCGVEYAYYGAH